MFGDLIAVKNDDTFLGNLISKFTGSDIVHVGMRLFGNEYVEATLSGIKISTLDKLKNKDYWICKLAENYSKEILLNQAAVKFFVGHRIGERYDFTQLFKFIPYILSCGLYTPKEDNDFYVCSELVASIYEMHGVLGVEDIDYLFHKNGNINTSTITPADLFNLNIYKEKEFVRKQRRDF